MAIAQANLQARHASQHRQLVSVCRLVHGDPATSHAITSSPRLIRITPLPHEPRCGWPSHHRRVARPGCPNLRAAAASPIAGHLAGSQGLAGPHLRRGQPPDRPPGPWAAASLDRVGCAGGTPPDGQPAPLQAARPPSTRGDLGRSHGPSRATDGCDELWRRSDLSEHLERAVARRVHEAARPGGGSRPNAPPDAPLRCPHPTTAR